MFTSVFYVSFMTIQSDTPEQVPVTDERVRDRVPELKNELPQSRLVLSLFKRYLELDVGSNQNQAERGQTGKQSSLLQRRAETT